MKQFEFTFTNLANQAATTVKLPQIYNSLTKLFPSNSKLDLIDSELNIGVGYSLAECNQMALLLNDYPELDINVIEDLYREIGDEIFIKDFLDRYHFFKICESELFVYELIKKNIISDISLLPFSRYLDFELIGDTVLQESSVIHSNIWTVVTELVLGDELLVLDILAKEM